MMHYRSPSGDRILTSSVLLNSIASSSTSSSPALSTSINPTSPTVMFRPPSAGSLTLRGVGDIENHHLSMNSSSSSPILTPSYEDEDNLVLLSTPPSSSMMTSMPLLPTTKILTPDTPSLLDHGMEEEEEEEELAIDREDVDAIEDDQKRKKKKQQLQQLQQQQLHRYANSTSKHHRHHPSSSTHILSPSTSFHRNSNTNGNDSDGGYASSSPPHHSGPSNGKASKVLRILNPIPLDLSSYGNNSFMAELEEEEVSMDCCHHWSSAATHIFFSQQFPTLYIVLILLNVLSLGIIVYEHVTSKWEDGYPAWFIVLELSISIAFAIELGIRLVSTGRKFFESFSNIFDLCTLLLCLVSFGIYFRLELHETQAEELAALFLLLRYSAQFLRLMTLVKNRQKTIHLSQSIVDFSTIQGGDHSGDDEPSSDEERIIGSSNRMSFSRGGKVSIV